MHCALTNTITIGIDLDHLYTKYRINGRACYYGTATIVALLYIIYILWGICAFPSYKIGEDILKIIEDYLPMDVTH